MTASRDLLGEVIFSATGTILVDTVVVDVAVVDVGSGGRLMPTLNVVV